jgi:hypothetical protein
MTPTAVTPAARKRTRPSGSSDSTRPGSKAPSSTRPSSQRPSSPHPSTPRPAHRTPRSGVAAPTAPRRVSGPARSSHSTRTAPRTAAPKRRAARAATARQQSVPSLPLQARALAFARSLPDHSLLDRLIRSRIWIPLLGVLLVGIVASQVEILKLNASLGHGVVRAAQLQSEDQRLANAVSQMSDVQRIESKAAQMGLSMPAAYTPVFLPGGRGDLRRALANIHKPDPAAFEARGAALASHRAAEVQSSSGA